MVIQTQKELKAQLEEQVMLLRVEHDEYNLIERAYKEVIKNTKRRADHLSSEYYKLLADGRSRAVCNQVKEEADNLRQVAVQLQSEWSERRANMDAHILHRHSRVLGIRVNLQLLDQGHTTQVSSTQLDAEQRD